MRSRTIPLVAAVAAAAAAGASPSAGTGVTTATGARRAATAAAFVSPGAGNSRRRRRPLDDLPSPFLPRPPAGRARHETPPLSSTGSGESSPSATRDPPPASPSSSSSAASAYDDRDAYVRESRAGEDGYSLLRRPATFDDESDPIFGAPVSMDEAEEEERRDANRAWFEGRRGGDGGGEGGGRASGRGGGVEADGRDRSGGEGTAAASSKPSTSSGGGGGRVRRTSEGEQTLDVRRRTLETLDYPAVLRALADECGTVAGRKVVEESIDAESGSGGGRTRPGKGEEEEDPATMPLSASSAEGARRRYGAVTEMRRLMDGRASGFYSLSREAGGGGKGRRAKKIPLGPPPMANNALDLDPILELIDAGRVLGGPEILDVASMLEVATDAIDWSKALLEASEGADEGGDEDDDADGRFVELPRLASSLAVDPALLSLLAAAFDDDGRLDGSTFPSVGRLRAAAREKKREVASVVESVLASPSTRAKLATEAGGALTMEVDGRLVIPVQQRYGDEVGIVHDASRSGRTCYVEPSEAVLPTNELRRVEAELRAEEAKAWRSLTEAVTRGREEVERNVAILGQLDAASARVKLGRRIGGTVPTVGDGGALSVKGARHPVLLLRGLEDVVGSDVEVGRDGNRGLILTGPNSGGKTVILKLLGLYALMARDGIPVPSEPGLPARVDYFSPVLADIGDIQSVDGDLSTFSGHMLVCREVLNNAGKDALVLMDELGSGTDPNQGVAIARALLEALLDRGARVALTTHYMELKQLASSDERFAVAGMQFVGGRPTYRLLPGVVGESFALAVAERLELPPAVIERANNLLDQETREMGELIRDLEDQKLLVDEKARELEAREYELRELKVEMKKQQQKLEAKQLNARRDEAQKFAAKLEEKERLLEGILEKLKGSGASKKVVADSWSDIRIVKREALAEAENVPGVMHRLKQQQSGLGEVDLIPISEMKGINKVNVDDAIIVCKKGAFYGKEGLVKQVGKKIQVVVGGVPVRLTTKEIAFPPSSGQVLGATKPSASPRGGPKMSKMAQRALELDSAASDPSPVDIASSSSPSDRGTTMKTKSNTVDCIGLTFEESKRKCIDAFGRAAMQNRSTVYVLHGHGTGVLKKKIRSWLQGDRRWAKSFRAADQADGGDALTKVELKKQNLF
ncbi:hypothetical protein ACHAWF_012320 [Thalassiosira exigua]